MTSRRLIQLTLILALIQSTAARAATIAVGFDGGAAGAPRQDKVISPGGSTIVDIYLSLSNEEVASVFEATFNYVATGILVQFFDPASDPTNDTTTEVRDVWSSVAGNLGSTQGRVSLTSDNAGGLRLVGRFFLFDDLSAPGASFLVSLANGAIVAKDLASPPFLESVPLLTPGGTELAMVIPEPGTALLLGAALLGLSGWHRRR